MNMIRALGAFVRRDWYITRSYRLQFALELVGLLFQLTLFFFLGQLVDRSNVDSSAGLDQTYFAFVVLGLALLNLLNTALTSFSSTLRTEQTTGSLEALLTTPQSSSLVIMGSSSYQFIRAGLQMVMFISLGVIFFGLRFTLDLWSLLVALVVLVASLGLFAALGIIVAAATLVYKRADSILSLITGSIALLGGVYFPVSLLPAPLRFLADLIPFTWAVDTLRQALLQGTVDTRKLVSLIIVATLMLPPALWLLGRALRHARQEGSLAQY